MNRPINIYIILLQLLFFAVSLGASADTIPMRNCRPTRPSKSSLKEDFISSPFKGDRRKAPFVLSPSPLADEVKYIGSRHQLTILVSFNDQDFMQEDPLPVWERIFNEKNYNEQPFCGSVHDYFYDQSYGQFLLTFDLYRIALDETRVKYKSTYSDDENSQYLVDDLVDVLLTKDIDWSRYDWDNDGYIDQLLIVYAGLGMNDGGGSNSIWPHQWWLSLHENLETDDPNDYRSYRTVTQGDKQYIIDCYCCLNERASSEDEGTFGTIIHEYSHCFGFPDFYNGSTSYVGGWDLMDRGNYNGDGYCPPSYSAHERMLMGWLQPIELTQPIAITQMEATSTHPQAYIIRNSAVDNEFYVLENRQPTKWDSQLPGSGIIVAHVIFDPDVWTWGAANSSSLKRYTIFPANNNTSTLSAADWPYPYQQNDSLTNLSAPAATLYYDNVEGDKPIKNMKVENGQASFTFLDADPSSHIEELLTVNSPSGDLEGFLYDLTGRQIVNGKSVNGKLPRGLYIVNGKKILVK